MVKKSLSDKLREQTNRSLRAKTKRDQAKAEDKNASIAKQAKKIAGGLIADLPKKLKAAAQDGQTRLMVLDSSGWSSYELYQAVRSLLCQYANDNGIRWENGLVEYSDELSYDSLNFHWDRR